MRRNRFEIDGRRGGENILASSDLPDDQTVDLSGLQVQYKGEEVVEVVARFSRGELTSLRVRLTFLLQLPNLWKPLARGFILHFDQLAPSSITNASGDLRTGIVAFLVEMNKAELSLSDFDREIWGSFVQWMNATDGDGIERLNVQTRARRLGTLRLVFEALVASREYGETAARALDTAPRSPWLAAARKVTPRKRLDRSHLLKILRSSVSELISLEKRFSEGEERLSKGQLEIATGEFNLGKSFNALLAVLEREFPVAIPRKHEMTDEQLRLAVIAKKNFGGLSAVSAYLYPTPRNLTPFVLALAVALGMNPETLLSLNRSDVQYHSILGKEVVVFHGRKDRASSNPTLTVRMDSEIWTGYSMRRLLSLLDRITKRIRPGVTIQSHRDRLFVFVGEAVTHAEPRGFGGSTTHSLGSCCTDITFTHNLKRFIRDHSLEYFSLSQIRATVLDETFILTGDIKAVQAVGQQKNPWTILSHYTSDGTRSRLMERLGGSLFMLRERWWSTEGKIDPRADSRGYGRDRGAATPGFHCLDPFDSRRPGQRPGRLCSAYGECPACELAAGSDSVDDVANYLALRSQLLLLMADTSDVVWIRQWRPVLSSLEQMLALIPDETFQQAQKLRVRLPPLPALG